MPDSRDGQNVSPSPRLSVRVVGSRGGWEDLVLPRGYLYLDGDGTNAAVSVGIDVGTKHGGSWLSFGLELVVPPRLFWLVDPLYRRDGRGAESMTGDGQNGGSR